MDAIHGQNSILNYCYYFVFSTYRSWIYVDDCSEAIRRITERGRLGQIYNIGTEFELENIDLTRMIHEKTAKQLKQ